MASPRTSPIRSGFQRVWTKFLGLARWAQVLVVALIVLVLGGILVLARGGSADTSATTEPTVTLQSLDSFGANANGVDVLGTVNSVSEADIVAQSGGTVESIHTSLGANVPAGFVIANLDSAAASAAVLQAQGSYDAAVAAQKATNLQAQNSTGSFAEQQTSVRNLYQSTYTSLESTLINNVDVFFGNNTPVGPQLLINPLGSGDTFPRERRSITMLMDSWNTSLADVDTTDPITLLSTSQSNLTTVSTFLTNLATLAQMQGSGATPAQLASLATAQANVNALLASVSAARTAYNAAATASAVGQTQSSGGSGVTSSEASVEVALGGLRAAQAAYEKTIVRAPIAGTVNYLPIHIGDNVTPNQHVATVARNNALEVVMELAQGDANRLAVGDTLTIDGSYKGVVTTIAPALDPTTKQIEVHVAVNDGSDLVNGQSVQVALPTLPTDVKPTTAAITTTSTTTATSNTVELPLTAVKLLPNERDIFTVDTTGHIISHQVTIGSVIGDRIQITTSLPNNAEIISDVRGLSAGDAVMTSTSTAATQ